MSPSNRIGSKSWSIPPLSASINMERAQKGVAPTGHRTFTRRINRQKFMPWWMCLRHECHPSLTGGAAGYPRDSCEAKSSSKRSL
ncbi:hypothetical protein ACWHAM_23090 [Paenibacillus terrae]